MSYYINKVKRKTGVRYRIVHDRIINGRRKRTYQTLPAGTSKTTALEIKNNLALESTYGDFVKKEPISFDEFATGIYFKKYTTFLSPTTVEHYQQLYNGKNGLKKKLGGKYLNEITAEVLQDMINDYVKAGLAPKTIRNYVSLACLIIDKATVNNYIRRKNFDIRSQLELPKLNQEKGNAYTMGQVREMLEIAKETKNRNVQLILILTCLAGGLRRSELAGLRWEDITLNSTEAFITIDRAIVHTHNGQVTKDPKTQSGNRIIPINVNGTIYNLLQDARKEYLKTQSNASAFEGDNHVLVTIKEPHTPLSPGGVAKAFKRFMLRDCSHLPRYRLHDLRHTYFTLCKNVEGFSELSMIGTGGHSSIRSTQRYLHSQMPQMLDDMGKLEAAFDNTERKAK